MFTKKLQAYQEAKEALTACQQQSGQPDDAENNAVRALCNFGECCSYDMSNVINGIVEIPTLPQDVQPQAWQTLAEHLDHMARRADIEVPAA